MKKCLKIFVLSVMLLAIMTSFAIASNKFTIGTPTNKITDTTVLPAIIGAVQWVGYAIAVGMLVYIGIKYIMASASEKADLKGALVKYVVGAIIIVFATTIASWVFSLNSGASSESSSNLAPVGTEQNIYVKL